MKKLFLLLFLFYDLNSKAQDVINPYIDYDGQPYLDLRINNSFLTYNFNTVSNFELYNGEYEILLDKYPWGNPNLIRGHPNPIIDLSNYALSYQIELVSFPFSIDCAFPSLSDPGGGCDGLSTERLFNVPDDNYMDSITFYKYWEYPETSFGISNRLSRFSSLKPFDRQSLATISDQSHNNVLVSAAFGEPGGATFTHMVFPHSVLKHTINIHCGNDIDFAPIISSFSFMVDLTRGRLREYPFRSNLSTGGLNNKQHDLLIRPILLPSSDHYNNTETVNCYHSRLNSDYDYCDIDKEGSNINYTPFDPVLDNNCIQQIPGHLNAEYDDYFCSYITGQKMERLPLANYSLNISTSVRNYDGTTLAGYINYDGQTDIHKIPIDPIVHQYTINNNIKLDRINPSELIIYNPSEVNITANNLIFPTNYTFKTIRGVFPFASEVDAAASDTANGGPFTDPTKRDVPVVTDLYKDFHVSSHYDSLNQDHRYASIYHLLSGSKLTIEPCVKIFDATFEINPASEIVFEDWSTNQINVNRYQMLYNGGTVTKQNNNFLFQNDSEEKNILKYKAGTFILAGADVDPGKTSGEYSIEPNAQVEFVANNFIDLKSGFYAKDESRFEASIAPVTIPPCGPMRIRNPKQNNTAYTNRTSEIGYFTISPNPAKDNSYFMFEIFEKSNAQIFIYDSMGKIIQQVGEKSLLPGGKYSFKFQSEDLAPGIYFAKLLTRNSEKSIKFIKQ